MEDVVQLFDKVDQNREAMVDTWKLLVDRDCGSGNKAGVDGVGRDVKDFLENADSKSGSMNTKRQAICLLRSTVMQVSRSLS